MLEFYLGVMCGMFTTAMVAALIVSKDDKDMTNRRKLLETNEYDTLLKMQENLEQANVAGEELCIMDALGVQAVGVRHRIYNGNCKMCVAEWLGEENHDS